jgi:hypothetical protein
MEGSAALFALEFSEGLDCKATKKPAREACGRAVRLDGSAWPGRR